MAALPTAHTIYPISVETLRDSQNRAARLSGISVAHRGRAPERGLDTPEARANKEAIGIALFFDRNYRTVISKLKVFGRRAISEAAVELPQFSLTNVTISGRTSTAFPHDEYRWIFNAVTVSDAIVVQPSLVRQSRAVAHNENLFDIGYRSSIILDNQLMPPNPASEMSNRRFIILDPEGSSDLTDIWVYVEP